MVLGILGGLWRVDVSFCRGLGGVGLMLEASLG